MSDNKDQILTDSKEYCGDCPCTVSYPMSVVYGGPNYTLCKVFHKNAGYEDGMIIGHIDGDIRCLRLDVCKQRWPNGIKITGV